MLFSLGFAVIIDYILFDLCGIVFGTPRFFIYYSLFPADFLYNALVDAYKKPADFLIAVTLVTVCLICSSLTSGDCILFSLSVITRLFGFDLTYRGDFCLLGKIYV